MADARIVISAQDRTASAVNSARARLATLGTEARAVSDNFAAFGAAFTGALATTGLGAFLASAIESLDALNDLADATGASIENLSALRDIASRTGTSFDTVSGALVKFNQALAGAKAGTDAERVFKALGLSVQQLQQLDPAQALLQTSRALANFADDGNKARAAQELFGRSLREVAPLLGDLAAAGDLVATSTSEQAKQAEAFQQTLARLRTSSADFARSTAAELLPTLNGIAQALEKAKAEGQGFTLLGAALRTAFETLAIVGANVVFVFQATGREIGAIAAQLAALARFDFAGFTAISEAVKADGERARAELDAFQDRVLNRFGSGRRPANEGGGTLRSRQTPSLNVPAAPVKAQVSEFDQYIARLRDAQLATLDLSQVEQTRIDIAIGKLGKLTEAQKTQALEAARQLDQLKAKDPLGDFIRTLESARPQKSMDEIFDTVGRSTGARFDDLVRRTENVIAAMQRGNISAQDYARALEVLGEEFKALEPKVDDTGNKLDEFAAQAARNIQDALGDTLLATLEGNFKSIGRLWVDLLKRMAAQAAAAQIGKTLFGEDFAKTGNARGLLGDLVKFVVGGTEKRATGGPVAAGRPYIVGERGPELIVPRAAGTVLPNAALAPRGGDTFIIQGDVGSRALKAMRLAQAEAEARRLYAQRA